MAGPNSSEQRVQKVLREIRSGSRLGWDEFAERVGDVGFQVSPAAVRGYEEGRTKKVPITYVDAVCRAFGASPTSFFVEDPGEAKGSLDEAEQQLSAIRRILREPMSGGPVRTEAPHDPESLRRRFLSAISEYSLSVCSTLGAPEAQRAPRARRSFRAPSEGCPSPEPVWVAQP